MIRVLVIAVGKPGRGVFGPVLEQWETRLRPVMRLETRCVQEAPFRSIADRARVLDEEETRIRKVIPEGSVLVVLEAQGRALASERFTELLWELSEQETRTITVVLGGPLGLSDQLKQDADVLLSLSPLTMPHDLAHAVLLEQLYRAYTIRAGKAYHY